MPAVHGDLMAPVFPTEEYFPDTIFPRQVTLRDRITIATLVPFPSSDLVPRSLLGYLSDQLNKEIEKGDTYAMTDPIPFSLFGPYWFSNFGAIMLLGDIKSVEEVQAMDQEGTNWSKTCLGSFNIRPNYPGRSNHVCNGMFIVTDAARNKGVGRLMGETYLEWAPRMGYTYAVFNLVYETNVASCRIWDSLGFKRIGRVPGGGRLLSNPGQFVDAIIYGRDLNLEGDDSVSQDRFEKIRYYLKHAKYPRGADRAEKSRLRSAATHYKLIGGEDGEPERLMLKGKEVVSDPQQQYDIAQDIHNEHHAGINKTTAAIAVKYHWVRIKETVSRVIRDCPECKETLKTTLPNGIRDDDPPETEERTTTFHQQEKNEPDLSSHGVLDTKLYMDEGPSTQTPSFQNTNPFAPTHAPTIQEPLNTITDYSTMPLDPQMIETHAHLSRFPHYDTMADPYSHGSHILQHTNFDDEVRHHAANEYQMMVDDPDGTGLRPETLGLVHPQANELQDAHEILNKYAYGGRPEDDLDFT
ncbi:hypothetical protein SI65_01070 [Aspergillus cristatus]|uniref:N-acetyltransferase domain-containing protein n=1 Tax=Aspergillus cristatus TaxID=573508 RepID=A0A1E3BRS9_ASPCR|nr:hypothetical protein SI65_01070 [Aspergillus cristatus]